MRPEDEAKTAFKTHHGHFQFRVMPLGVTNGPPTFQCLINSVFAPVTRKYVIAFLDDILTYIPSFDEHLQHLRQVFATLRQHQLYAKFSKCTFARPSINYLGHVISAEGVATEADKTTAIQNWPQPSSPTELRAFLGLTGYYRKFVRNYSIVMKPLTSLLSKKGFMWSDAATSAFQKLKEAHDHYTGARLARFLSAVHSGNKCVRHGHRRRVIPARSSNCFPKSRARC